jgi:hypothetical protein
MKTKIVSLLLAFGLITNAAIAGNSAKIGYASDYFYRGAQKSQESIQGSLMFGHSFGSVNASAHICSNQAIKSGNDSYHIGGGVAKSFADDLLSAYVGINHFEDVPGDVLSEVQLTVSSDMVLSPSVSIFRDLDDSLYTFELNLSHSVETDLATFNFGGSVGSTELTSSTDRDYHGLSASASKSLSENADLSIGFDYVDADNIDDELVFGSSISFKF